MRPRWDFWLLNSVNTVVGNKDFWSWTKCSLHYNNEYKAMEVMEWTVGVWMKWNGPHKHIITGRSLLCVLIEAPRIYTLSKDGRIFVLTEPSWRERQPHRLWQENLSGLGYCFRCSWPPLLSSFISPCWFCQAHSEPYKPSALCLASPGGRTCISVVSPSMFGFPVSSLSSLVFLCLTPFPRPHHTIDPIFITQRSLY